jgi:hypothetical protein
MRIGHRFVSSCSAVLRRCWIHNRISNRAIRGPDFTITHVKNCVQVLWPRLAPLGGSARAASNCPSRGRAATRSDRHSCALVQMLLGHSFCVDHADLYTQVARESLKELHAKHHPRD